MTSPRALPLLGHLRAFAADRLGFLTAVAREQGDVATFRIGPYRVWLLSHPDEVRRVLVGEAHRFRKGPVLQRARLVLGEGLLTAEGDRHRHDRRRVQHAFHPRRIEAYAATMVAQVERSSEEWAPDHPVDLHQQMVRATLATAGATLLGADVEGDVEVVEGAVADLLSAYRLAFVPFGWRLQRVPVGPARRLQRGRQALHDLVDRMIADRRAAGIDRGDLLSALVLGPEDATSGPGDRVLTDAEIRDHAVTLLLAGHETTANALTFAFHLLTRHPAVEAAIHEEVDAVVGSRLPAAGDLDRLRRCRALFAESLRLYPPSWAIAREVVNAHDVAGATVPPGDLVVVASWVVHRDPRWWEAAEHCRLDRWAGDGASPAAGRARRKEFFPFGGGIRQCIGEGFAWTEGTLAIATIARRWRLRAVPGRDLDLEPLITLRPRGGLPMLPWPRASA